MSRYFSVPWLVAIVIMATTVTAATAVNNSNHGNSASGEMQAALEQLRAARREFNQARQQAGQSNGQQSGQAQSAAQQNRFEHRHRVMARLFDLHQKHLERTRARVQNMPNITDEEKATATAKIDDALAKVAAQGATIAAVTDDEDLKSLITVARDQLRSYHEIVKSAVAAIHASHLNILVSRANDRAVEIGTQLDSLTAAGQDMTAGETKLTEAEDLIDTASSQSASGDHQSAVTSLKEAYQLFREIIQGTQGQNNSNTNT